MMMMMQQIYKSNVNVWWPNVTSIWART